MPRFCFGLIFQFLEKKKDVESLPIWHWDPDLLQPHLSLGRLEGRAEHWAWGVWPQSSRNSVLGMFLIRDAGGTLRSIAQDYLVPMLYYYYYF